MVLILTLAVVAISILFRYNTAPSTQAVGVVMRVRQQAGVLGALVAAVQAITNALMLVTGSSNDEDQRTGPPLRLAPANEVDTSGDDPSEHGD